MARIRRSDATDKPVRILRLTTRSLIACLVVILVSYIAALSTLAVSKFDDDERQQPKQQNSKGMHPKDTVPSVKKTQKSINSVDNVVTIGVASTVTGCGEEPFQDGAAVLKYSLDQHSAANPESGNNSKYHYKMYILYHPDAAPCVLPLQKLGYTLLERPPPVAVEDIRGEELRERIVDNGCCGEKELIKLEAYRLVEHTIIIHLDLDVLILKPMDNVIDFMLDPTAFRDENKKLAIHNNNLPIMWPNKEIPDDVQLMFTKDYNIVAPKRQDKPYQGGFFMIKPSIDVYNEFVEIVRAGDYHIKGGWGKKVGPFYGGMTIQGLLPWYYEHLHPGHAVELNRCAYNNMSDKPKLERKNGTERCRTNEETCEDCRKRPKQHITTFHFTICQKPWSCLEYKKQNDNFKLCREMNHEWYVYRSRLEQSWGRSGHGDGEMKAEHYFGNCRRTGLQGYVPMEFPGK